MSSYDLVIVGASFSGLTLAHHLSKHLRVLVLDVKPEVGSTVESTGLITNKTRDEFASFIDINRYITNPITSICVIAPNFSDFFVSRVDEPWIHQTDTKALVKALADTLPANVEIRVKTAFLGVDDARQVQRVKIQTQGKPPEEIETRFLVGADGSHSRVAKSIDGLSCNKRFLFGYEQVLFGNVHFGDYPAQTIYHFWFGEFSLGYGGWLSPTIVEGRPAFRIGLAKLEKDRGQAKELMQKFIQTLLERKMISIDAEIDKPGYIFGSLIPIGGVLRNVADRNVLLVGDAAGYCGAFAADGIKGSVVSGKEAAGLIERYLRGETLAPTELSERMQVHGGLVEYYKRQVRYRFVWDRMKSNRTFQAMYAIIEKEKETFLDQFCDSKDTRRSLSRTVLKGKHIPALVRYAWFIALDLFK